MSVGNMRACSRASARAVAACAAVVAVGVRNADATAVDYTFKLDVAQVPGYRCYTLLNNSDHKEVMFAEYFDLMGQKSATLLDAFKTTFGGDEVKPYMLKHRAVNRGTAAQSPVAVCANDQEFMPARINKFGGHLTDPDFECKHMVNRGDKDNCLVKTPKAVLFWSPRSRRSKMMVSPVVADGKELRHFKELLNADNADQPIAVLRLVGLAMKYATDHKPAQVDSAETRKLTKTDWKPNRVYLHTHGLRVGEFHVRLDTTDKRYASKELKEWAEPRQASTKPPTTTPVDAPEQDTTTREPRQASTKPPTTTPVDAPKQDATTNGQGNLKNYILMSGLVVMAIVCGLVAWYFRATVCGSVARYFGRCRPSKTHDDGANDDLPLAGGHLRRSLQSNTHDDGAKDNLVVLAHPVFSELSGRVLLSPELQTRGQ